METFFDVDRDLCRRDGLCAAECPAQVIRLGAPDPVPTAAPDFALYCLACGHCVAVCPTGAFRLAGMPPEQCPSIEKGLQPSREQAEQFLRSRRSIRLFREERVARAKLAKLIEIACYAPSAKNSQPWNWTVVEEPAEVRRLAGMVVDWMRAVIQAAPERAAAAAFPRVVDAWDQGCDRVCRAAPHLIVVHADRSYPFGAEDTALALSYLELYAPQLGLGACWAGYFYTAVNAHPPLFEALGLPAAHRAFGAVMVGVPKLRYRRLPQRRPPRILWR